LLIRCKDVRTVGRSGRKRRPVPGLARFPDWEDDDFTIAQPG
jgi:hypothetical protein